MRFARLWIVCTALVFCILAGAKLFFSNQNEGVNIAAQKNDPELSGSVAVAENGTYQGKGERNPAAKFIAQYSTHYENGNARVVKTIFANDMPYQTRDGHYVFYEYFRLDGSLEHDNLVEPEAHLGCSVLEKYRLRYFDKSNSQTEERYVRPDGSLGAQINTINHAITWFYQDGVTVREKQTTDANGVTETRFRKDGKTVWWSTDYSDPARTHVHFDQQGKPIDKVFISESAHGDGAFSMGSNDSPKLLSTDTYLRPNGTTDYVQTWYEVYDKNTDLFKEEIGEVTVYDGTGKNELRTYFLDLKEEGEPRFIKEVIIHDPTSKTTLDRKFSSPNQRSFETVISLEDGALVGHRVAIAANDWFQEPVDDLIFQGFDDELWGNPDANPHDI
jgi:hypothetical protein